jgi:hypothetical protein
MSENDKKDLQWYVEKVKELKEWKSRSDDEETIGYLKLEIDKLLSKMNDMLNRDNDKR